jgi:peptidoglycan/xylan/chitin deacetylase (PgdA/CDA1 family)
MCIRDSFMTKDELRLLAEDGQVEVGAHTVTHPDLALLPAAEQKNEIVAGKKRLEELTGLQVESFSYPYGTRGNYSGETIRLVKEAGFVCACSNFAGAVRPGADRYQLPRMLVRNWTRDEFAERLSGFFR